MKKEDLTQRDLKEFLDYDLLTGVFVWLKVSKYRPQLLGKIAGCLFKRGYRYIKINEKSHQSHRLAFLWMTGDFPTKGMEVDHINGERSDNRWCNLRLVNRAENMKNQKIYKNNTSGHLGVHHHKDGRASAWEAYIKADGKRKGKCFPTYEEAIKQRTKWEIEFGYHPNHGRNKS